MYNNDIMKHSIVRETMTAYLCAGSHMDLGNGLSCNMAALPHDIMNPN